MEHICHLARLTVLKENWNLRYHRGEEKERTGGAGEGGGVDEQSK